MRAGLIALLMAGATVFPASPGRPQDRLIPRSPQTAGSLPVPPLSQLADRIPDGTDLIDLYKAARTVADVEAANAKVKDEVVGAQSVASDLARLHAAKMTACEDTGQSHLEATAARAQSLSGTLVRIDGELVKSLAAMRQRLAADRTASTRAKGDINRYTVAANELGRLNLQTRELAKAIQGVALSIKTAAASCNPTPIPPLFAEANQPNKVATVTRPPPAPRRRPAAAAQRSVRFLSRF